MLILILTLSAAESVQLFKDYLVKLRVVLHEMQQIETAFDLGSENK